MWDDGWMCTSVCVSAICPQDILEPKPDKKREKY